MTNRSRDLALFFCGFETFHALSHAYFALSRTTLHPFGITLTPAVHAGAAVANGIIALGLEASIVAQISGRGVERTLVEERRETAGAVAR